jgi:GDP-L-fucose synthase
MSWLATKRILVTGGNGFLGRYVVGKLKQQGCKDIFVPRSEDYNLVEMEAVRKVYRDAQPDIVINLAGIVGGIGANMNNPGSFFYKNLMMGVQMIEEGRLFGVEKFVALGTVCAYPKFAPVPFNEENLWNGYPEETNAPYGLAKKMLLVQSQAYRQQYGFNSIYLLPVNLYGPGDNFDPESSHVIPALIKKVFDAIDEGENHIDVWGTGKATQEFLYVEDAAEGIALATENYSKPEPVNLGSGFEISIKELVEMICEFIGFDGEVVWDTSKPDGQPKRCLDVTRARKEFGFEAKTDFKEGLRTTIDWYEANRCVLSKIKKDNGSSGAT